MLSGWLAFASIAVKNLIHTLGGSNALFLEIKFILMLSFNSPEGEKLDLSPVGKLAPFLYRYTRIWGVGLTEGPLVCSLSFIMTLI